MGPFLREVRFMRVRVVALVALLSALAGSAAGTGILTVDRFVGMVRCSDPQLSPDGSLVAFVVSTPDAAANRSGTDIWLERTAGGEPVRLTNSPGADYHPRWSPDGRHIAFVSMRSGSAQVWILPVAGGEARQLTHISSGANDPVWSPDGRRIAFYSAVYPDCATDSCNAARAEAAEANPVKARVYTALLYRHWNEWRSGTRNHLFVADAETGVFEDLTAGRDFDYPTFPFGGSAEYAFSPDGREICVSAKEAAVEAISTNTDLFVIDLAGRGMRKITTNEAADETPAYSPDGRWLAWRAQSLPGFESDRWRLMLLDRKTGEARSVTEDFDRWVSDYCWTPDSRG